MTKTKNGYKISFLIVLTMVVLSFCVCIGSVVAWLKYDYSNTTSPRILTIGDIISTEYGYAFEFGINITLASEDCSYETLHPFTS